MVLDPFSVLEEEDDFSLEGEDDAAELQEAIGEMPRETLWALLIVLVSAQVGLFAASLGLMLVHFRGQWTIGGSLVVGGLLALAVAVAVYRWHERVASE